MKCESKDLQQVDMFKSAEPSGFFPSISASAEINPLRYLRDDVAPLSMVYTQTPTEYQTSKGLNRRTSCSQIISKEDFWGGHSILRGCHCYFSVVSVDGASRSVYIRLRNNPEDPRELGKQFSASS